MEIIPVFSSGLQSNTYVIRNGTFSAVIDPAAPLPRIFDAVGETQIKYILLTHGHFDHMMSLEGLLKITDAEVCIHRCDADFLTDAKLNVSELLVGVPTVFDPPDRILSDGDEIPLGDDKIKVIHTPGHTQGSVCYSFGNDLVCGDVVFANGYGRYDLPRGSSRDTAASLKKLSSLPPDFQLYPGHGISCRLADSDALRRMREIN